MKYYLYLLIITSFCVQAQNPEYTQLSKNLALLDDISAEFVQHTFDGKGALLQTQKGIVTLKKPNMFRWKTEGNFEQLLVSNGETLWQYDADLEQVTVQTLNKKLSATPALLLSGNSQLIESEYDIFSEMLQDEQHFVLIPKQTDTLFDRLRLEFNGDKRLSRMVIQDEIGQKTIIRLQNVHTISDLTPASFTFKIPDGVDVIRSE